MSDRETEEIVAIVERGVATALRGTTLEILRRITLTENDRHAHHVAGRSVEAAACSIREQALREAFAVMNGQAFGLPLRAWVKARRYTVEDRGRA